MESPAPGVASLHRVLVDNLKNQGHIRTPRVEAAFRAVPRHLFLPGVAPTQVYRDEAIITKRLETGLAVSSSSQPAAMAIMLEQLGLEPGHSVLEIGAGTGYNAALMAHVVGEAGQVVTVDIDQDLADTAREHLAAAGFAQVQVVCTDGGFGYPDAAPYDRIILTVGAWDIAPAWREQLKRGGQLLLPLSIRSVQRTIAFERVSDCLESVSVSGCSFITLRGAFAGPQPQVPLGAEPGLFLSVDDPSAVDAELAYSLLTGSFSESPVTIQVTLKELWSGLLFWLALREPGFCHLNAFGEWMERGIVPDLFRVSTSVECASTVGLLGESGLCVLTRPPSQPTTDDSSAFELLVRDFGAQDALAQHLVEQVIAWDKAGRPSAERLHIRAYSRGTHHQRAENEIVVEKERTRLVLDWK